MASRFVSVTNAPGTSISVLPRAAELGTLRSLPPNDTIEPLALPSKRRIRKSERMKTCPQCEANYPDSFTACPIHGCALDSVAVSPPEAEEEEKGRKRSKPSYLSEAQESSGRRRPVWIWIAIGVVLIVAGAITVSRLMEPAPPSLRADDPAASAAPLPKVNSDSWTVVAFSPDHRRLVSGSLDSEVKLWNLDSGDVLRTFQGQTGWIDSLAFSPDGRTVASGTATGAVKLWNVISGELERTLQDNTGKVNSVAFSPDGRILASAFCYSDGSASAAQGDPSETSSGAVELWDLTSGQMVRSVQEHAPCSLSVAFSPDGRTLASGNADGTIELWDVSSGEPKRTLRGHDGPVTAVAFSPISHVGHVLASGSSDHSVKIWDAANGTVIRTLLGHTGAITRVVFSSDGHMLASVSRDKTARLWNAMNGTLLRTLDDPTGPVYSVAFNHGGLTLVSGANEQTIHVWDLTGIGD